MLLDKTLSEKPGSISNRHFRIVEIKESQGNPGTINMRPNNDVADINEGLALRDRLAS